MSARKCLYSSVHHACDPGKPPNQYVGAITAELRVHFPPNTEPGLVRAAVDEAIAEIRVQHAQHMEDHAAAVLRREGL